MFELSCLSVGDVPRAHVPCLCRVNVVVVPLAPVSCASTVVVFVRLSASPSIEERLPAELKHITKRRRRN